MPPGSQHFDGWTFHLGTDGAGRDLLSAIFYGLRISLGVGIVSGVIALIIGAAIGMVAAYFGVGSIRLLCASSTFNYRFRQFWWR